MFLVIFILNCLMWLTSSNHIWLNMPGVRPTQEDQYICHWIDLNNATYYITEFQPNINGHNVHHALIYGINKPNSPKDTWTCDDLLKDDLVTKMVFSWSMNAVGTKLPKDISYMVGRNSNKRYLVLQTHYKNIKKFKENRNLKDYSGFILTVQTKPTSKLSIYYIFVTAGYIPKNSTVFMDAACTYKGKIQLHPYKFRVHTHHLGKLVSGYVIHNNTWREIGKMSPTDQQMFYPVNQNITVVPGDILAARCIITNNTNRTVHLGPRKNDEMCNFGLWYWIKFEDYDKLSIAENVFCFSRGYPNYSWNQSFHHEEIPDRASTLPGETKPIYEKISD